MNSPTVTDNPVAERFEAHIDGRLAGFAEYQLTDALIVFTHTEVDPAFEGQGVGSAIARFALDQLLASGTRQALLVCPFIKGWIQRHPEYLPITYGATPTRDERPLRITSGSADHSATPVFDPAVATNADARAFRVSWPPRHE